MKNVSLFMIFASVAVQVFILGTVASPRGPKSLFEVVVLFVSGILLSIGIIQYLRIKRRSSPHK